jgi:hypothetical protein
MGIRLKINNEAASEINTAKKPSIVTGSDSTLLEIWR